MQQQQQVDPLPHLTFNPSAPKTLVLLHGGFSCPLEYTFVTPHLKNYHILVPHLPGHSDASALRPFTLSTASSSVADLIRTHAHNGVADIAGISLGGIVALHLAARYPDVVEGKSVLASGVHDFRRMNKVFVKGFPYLTAVQLWIVGIVPASIFRALTRWIWDPPGPLPDEFQAEMRKVGGSGLGMGREMMKALVEEQGFEPVKARTLLVAARNEGGWLKGDSVEDARMVGRLVGRGNGESRAVRAEGCSHAWGVQDPVFFAEVVGRWVEGEELSGRIRDV